MPEIIITQIQQTQESSDTILLSNEVREIISSKPVWIVRNGVILFLLIICCLIALTFFIRYPDVVIAKAKFSSVNAPKEIKVKVGGKLMKLVAQEEAFAKQGQLLGFMESRANAYEVIGLSAIIDSLQLVIEHGKVEILPTCFLQPYQHLGEVQQAYQSFIQSFILFKQYLSSGYYLKKKVMLLNDILYVQRLHENLVEQKKIQEEDLSLAQKTFEANETLNDEKVISPLDYRNEKSKLILKSLNIPHINAAIISNENSSHEKQKEILQLENEIAQQKAIFSQALNTLKAQLEEWKTGYLLTAPVAGRISFAGTIQENQQLPLGKTICFINPEDTRYFAEIYIPQNNFGKIKEGQKVLLKLPSYPFQEFGVIKGKLAFIFAMPTDSGYAAKVFLSDGLRTNYNKQPQYKEGLAAEAEIITADTKLSDRLFNQLKSLSNQ